MSDVIDFPEENRKDKIKRIAKSLIGKESNDKFSTLLKIIAVLLLLVLIKGNGPNLANGSNYFVGNIITVQPQQQADIE